MEATLARPVNAAALEVGQTARIRVSQWFASSNHLLSRVWVGRVLVRTAKAVRLEGSVDVRESRFCHRCGREIVNPISILVGYGPICSDYLGIPRPEDLTPAQIQDIRDSVTAKTFCQMWLPLSVITVLEVTGTPIQGARSAPTGPIATPGVSSIPTPVEPPKPVVRPPAARFSIENNVIVARSSFEHKDRCKEVPGARWDKEGKFWYYPPSAVAAAGLIESFNPLAVEYSEAFGKLLARASSNQAASVHKKSTDLPPVPVSKTDAWLHQRRAFWFADGLLGSGPLG